MTTRKRKQPDNRKKKAPPKKAGLPVRVVTSVAALATRNPRTSAGAATFIVVFSFVAANALWYQHGIHPSPLLRTRLAYDNPQTTNVDVDQNNDAGQPRKVTTFVIKREETEAEEAAAAPAQEGPRPVPQPRGDETASIIRASERGDLSTGGVAPVKPSASALVAQVQTELSRRGLYEGEADGRNGPKTQAAVLQFEKQTHRRATGQATAEILAALRSARNAASPARPEERPYQNVKAEKGDLDSVAAAIRAADANPDYIPKADIPAASALVTEIQKGLNNLAYTDVRIDGVVSEQTRTAIRHFEKHYRLPQTGEPSPQVLKKLKEIGAL